ncbi:amidohydrolase family protein [Phytohabitans sp. ZYX-F-186]|uniref:Amidohydrolase family protein n=1 Tax=Phytohabitans maris TaxID=3071409 RepID=A0ABU0ZX13_9ACTN|nr:amidohydrolase family protein [Phytohabitans sp. ZYX-F-186]MDQ7910854.1 amidohydrolase family protein [Phytohabitans sp. ZYX-F-186]
MLRIEADLLIPGRGEPVRDGAVVVDGDLVGYAGPAATAPPTPGAETVRATTVMPGLWDCHTHLLGLPGVDSGQIPREPLALRGARSTVDLRAALDAGVTSVRELGGLGVQLARAVAEGTVDGPRIYAAGAILSTTGGHGDIHGFPLPWVHDIAATTGELRLCDGPAECAKAVREQLRRDAQVIKVCASGGVVSEVDHPIHQQFTGAELRAIVEVAGLAERAVAAHCHGKPGIMAALAAGVRTIEHATFLDEESAAAMRESGAIMVTTRTAPHDVMASRSAPAYALAKFDALRDRQIAAIALAHEAGVTLAAGTDIMVSGAGRPASWGRHGRELPLLAGCGLTPLEAIEAATAAGPATLGPRAPRSGQLLPGYDADVLTLDADPLADLTVLADPTHVTGVWLAGRRVKG